jgi:hypothetical protein
VRSGHRRLRLFVAEGHNTLADFGAVKVRSNPATADRDGVARTRASIPAIAAARPGSLILAGRPAIASAIRSFAVLNTGYGRPNAAPVTGSCPAP